MDAKTAGGSALRSPPGQELPGSCGSEADMDQEGIWLCFSSVILSPGSVPGIPAPDILSAFLKPEGKCWATAKNQNKGDWLLWTGIKKIKNKK